MAVKKSFFKWGAAVATLLILFNLPGGCTARLKSIPSELLIPVQRLFVNISRSLKEGADSVRGVGGMLEENSRLSEEVIYLQAQLVERENLEQQNRYLKEQLDFSQSSKLPLIPCQVSARSISGWWQSIQLDKGLSQGISTNRAVISPDGLVGRTATVSAHTTSVLLLSDPACTVSARVLRIGAYGLVSGRGVNAMGNPVVRMQFIRKDTPVEVGDTVVTSGLGGVFPKDLLIGYVERVALEESGLYQIADIIPKAVTELMDVVFVTTGDEHAEEQP